MKRGVLQQVATSDKFSYSNSKRFTAYEVNTIKNA